MNLLCIDTSTVRFGAVGIVKDDGAIFETSSPGTVTHSQWLFEALQALLMTSALKPTQLGGIAVCLGPGSFTGLRIGVALAKAMAFSLSIPVAGISTLNLLAMNASPGAGTIVPLIDAHRGELYGAMFENRQTIFPESSLSPEGWLSELRGKKSRLTLLGDGLLTYREQFERGLQGCETHFLETAAAAPKMANLALLALPLLLRGGDDLDALIPHYIRPPDARESFS